MAVCSGFADLLFADSAQLAFLRASERAETESYRECIDAWAIEDRRITLSFEIDLPRSVYESIKRFLGELTAQAIDGEAVLQLLHPYERCVLSATPSLAPLPELLVRANTTIPSPPVQFEEWSEIPPNSSYSVPVSAPVVTRPKSERPLEIAMGI